MNPNDNLSFDAAVGLAMGLADFERSTHQPGHSGFHLERMLLLSEELGSIHHGVPTVHVAGTKGKGSTAAMATSILRAAGYRVGLFTSPHLHSVVERIRIGLDPVAKETYAALVQQVWPAVLRVGGRGGFGGVSFFELMTAMAFLHFKQIEADYQVIEVGLGGRLDSTNVVAPVVSAITSISLDHVGVLGDTIEKIALEKAGIIKPGVPVVVAPQAEEEARAVFRAVAAEHGSGIVEVQDELKWDKRSADLTGQQFSLSGMRDNYELSIPLLGDHQLENAATAVAIAETLAGNGARLTQSSIVQGLGDVDWPGRLQVEKLDGRRIVIDGAHNPYSIRRLVEAVREYFEFDNVVLVFAALGGHSAPGMLAGLAPLSPKVVVVKSRHPRSGQLGPAVRAVSDAGLEVVGQSDTVAVGLRQAIDVAGRRDLVLCTGSLSLAAEADEELHGVEPEIYPNLIGPTQAGRTAI
jgi:dihydrofolate synthase/folylpolyglutamate synthase|tara:strand:- start:3800 stop:5200 length:1401 start_codon:yes stop_codon:yes gene_type:complete